MRAVREFKVVPAIPEPLGALTELATNVHWTWDRETQALVRTARPGRVGAAPATTPCGRSPPSRPSAGRCSPPTRRSSRPPRVAVDRLHDAIESPRWFQGRPDSPLGLVAYFSPEFGLSETLPQYSGGLGILAGDHLKATSDLGVPLVAIGLLYAEGYFRQRLNADGYQEERFPRLDPTGLALTPTGVEVVVDVAGDPVTVRAWKAADRPGAAVLPRHRGRRQQPRRLRHHRPAVRRRRRAPHAPGDRPRHRRRARAARPRPRPAGVPQQRGPRRLPLAGAHPRARRRGADVPRGDRGGARRRRVHHAHPGPGRHRPLPAPDDGEVLRHVRRRVRRRRSTS